MRSIGEILKRTREKRKLTIEDVQKYVKIHPKYLKALEKDNYAAFSSKVHSKGFLKIYSEFLGLDQNEILALWRRDYEKEIELKPKREFMISRELTRSKFIITPGIIFIFFVVMALVGFFSYLFYQYKTYTGVPSLEVFSPTEDLTLTRDILDIKGKTDLDSKIYINNEEIILGTDGSFAQSVKLKEGLNTISIKSVNDLNKESEIVRTIIYRPEKPQLIDRIIPSGSLPAGSEPGFTGDTAPGDKIDAEEISEDPDQIGTGGNETTENLE